MMIVCNRALRFGMSLPCVSPCIAPCGYSTHVMGGVAIGGSKASATSTFAAPFRKVCLLDYICVISPMRGKN